MLVRKPRKIVVDGFPRNLIVRLAGRSTQLKALSTSGS